MLIKITLWSHDCNVSTPEVSMGLSHYKYIQFSLLSILLFASGCNLSGQASDLASAVGSTSNSSPLPITENGVAVIPATLVQCPNGGMLIQSFVDLNHNSVFDATNDTLISETPICNGANGQNGLGAGIQVANASVAQCSAGGLKISTFSDFNNNGILNSGETVTSVNTICNGTNGTNGTNGNSFSVSQTVASSGQCLAGGVVYVISELDSNGVTGSGSSSSAVVCNGTNGLGVDFTTIPATTQQCASGGSVLLMASDSSGTGVYSITETNQKSVVICNGAAGAQGQAGPVSPFSPVKPITACGANSSPWKEVLLCMADGNILADFSADMGGTQTRLSFIPVGSYQNTDSSGCSFSVDNDGGGGYRVSWNTGSNQYATWSAGSVDCAPSTHLQ